MSKPEHCDITADLNKLNMISSRQIGDNLETPEDVCPPDSTHNYLSGSYRCEKVDYTTTEDSNLTITGNDVQTIDNCPSEINPMGNIQIPIVGYEVMEERARFTVYKLRIENKSTCDCWYVFRRYTDFVRLCSRLKHSYPMLANLIPRKKYFGNNFDPTFLEERIHGLQAFVNTIISIPELIENPLIQDFFCLNEPPAYSDTTEESRAIFEALEDTIYHLRHQLQEKDATIHELHSKLNEQTAHCENMKVFLKNSTDNCQKCSKDYDNYQKTIRDIEQKHEKRLSTSSSSSSKN